MFIKLMKVLLNDTNWEKNLQEEIEQQKQILLKNFIEKVQYENEEEYSDLEEGNDNEQHQHQHENKQTSSSPQKQNFIEEE